MKNVESYYDANAQTEWERFDRHRMEFAITLKALAEFLPHPPARILDCGGGPGRYSISLAQQGYQVMLLDLSAVNLALARKQAQEAGAGVKEYIHGNALDLARFSDGQFDAVLLLGPLYHLTRAGDRQRAVGEAVRVLRPGGRLFAAFITLFAPLRDAIAKGYLHEFHANPALTERFLESQVNLGASGFTEAWFAHPAEVATLMDRYSGGRLRMLTLLGVEGMAAGHEQHLNRLAGADFQFWADLTYRFAADPNLLGAADHLLYVGEKES